MAIGLQDVDGLKPSDFLLAQAKANIEGSISSEEVGRRLEEYYRQKDVRLKAEADRTFEADQVADRINLLLKECFYVFTHGTIAHSRAAFQRHTASCRGVAHHNITKNQWILDGDTIVYGSAGALA